ncbi:hypothetical protein [Pseudorhodobacter ferrugineus]|uniref:hypothetical protein n=1 Tax=Pseudorhodobacter ferrugineus TaxID=77008 RepID=UPI000A7A99FB|nr:hypothetical protein [Pseudorhodobacter ferrugineus]
MKRWGLRIVGIAVASYIALYAYSFYRSGYPSLPDLPDGAYTLSFKSGFRAIILDAEVPEQNGYNPPKYFRYLSVANRKRRYFGVPLEVQPWFKDAWSWCKTPTENEVAELQSLPDDLRRRVENARFEAVCRLDVDGTEILRGLVFSVPRL